MEYQLGKLRDEIEALASFVDSLLSSHASKILPDTKQDVSCTSSVPASQVLNDLLRRSPANVETVFSKHTHDPRGIPRQNFSCASQDVRFEFTDEDDLNELFNNMDMDNDGFFGSKRIPSRDAIKVYHGAVHIFNVPVESDALICVAEDKLPQPYRGFQESDGSRSQIDRTCIFRVTGFRPS